MSTSPVPPKNRKSHSKKRTPKEENTNEDMKNPEMDSIRKEITGALIDEEQDAKVSPNNQDKILSMDTLDELKNLGNMQEEIPVAEPASGDAPKSSRRKKPKFSKEIDEKNEEPAAPVEKEIPSARRQQNTPPKKTKGPNPMYIDLASVKKTEEASPSSSKEKPSFIPMPKKTGRNSIRSLIKNIMPYTNSGCKVLFFLGTDGNLIPESEYKEKTLEISAKGNPLLSEIKTRFDNMSSKALAFMPNANDSIDAITQLASDGSLILQLSLMNKKVESLKQENTSLAQGKSKYSLPFADTRTEIEKLKIDLKIAKDYLKSLEQFAEKGSKTRFSLVSDDQLDDSMKKHGLVLSKYRNENDNLEQEVQILQQKIEMYNNRIRLMMKQRKPLYTL